MKGKVIVAMAENKAEVKVYGLEEMDGATLLHNAAVTIIKALAESVETDNSVVVSAILHDLYEREE